MNNYCLGKIIENSSIMRPQNLDSYLERLFHLCGSQCCKELNLAFPDYHYQYTILNLQPFHVATLLKTLRFHSGLSMSQLGKITGFSKTSIAHRESSCLKNFPNINTLAIYSEAFKISISVFIVLLISIVVQS